jgi:acylphosphatase
MGDIRIRLIIKGRVQGVWFRDSARRKALEINSVYGWVKNRPDGTVEAVAEGPEEKIAGFVEWCHHGPPHANVTGVEVIEESWKGEFDSFDIEF